MIFGDVISPKLLAMPSTNPDERLRAAGMDEHEAKVEIACRLFDAGKLTIGHATRLAELTEAEFQRQLELRGLRRSHGATPPDTGSNGCVSVPSASVIKARSSVKRRPRARL